MSISREALSALADVGGIDARTARVMIGTSAGAIVAADLRLGRGSEEILEAATGAKLDGSPNHARAGWSSTSNLARRILGSSVIMARSSVPFGIRLPEPPSWLQRAFPGSLMAPSNRDWASDRYPRNGLTASCKLLRWTSSPDAEWCCEGRAVEPDT